MSDAGPLARAQSGITAWLSLHNSVEDLAHSGFNQRASSMMVFGTTGRCTRS